MPDREVICLIESLTFSSRSLSSPGRCIEAGGTKCAVVSEDSVSSISLGFQ
jgi:hypothetical protein